ncbi:MAG: hypothetical protein EOO85_33235, partial [Pedobacter sp.]
MRFKLTLSLFLIFCSIHQLRAQTTFSGKVKDVDEKKPMSGISITLKAKGATAILNYALSDDKGNYKLTFKTPSDSVLVTISGMSIKKQIISYLNKDQNLDFNVAFERIVLKEMTVKPPKIRRLDDTLNYDVDQFTNISDRTIGEVLRRMPGIKVADNGSIS